MGAILVRVLAENASTETKDGGGTTATVTATMAAMRRLQVDSTFIRDGTCTGTGTVTGMVPYVDATTFAYNNDRSISLIDLVGSLALLEAEPMINNLLVKDDGRVAESFG